MLWDALRAKRLSGLKFRRQHPVGPFFVDFYCPEHRLAVEVDGPIHEQHATRDRVRQRLLEEHGIWFIRLTSNEVENDLERCLVKILRAVSKSGDTSHPCPASGAGAGG